MRLPQLAPPRTTLEVHALARRAAAHAGHRLSAQARYAAGARETLEGWVDGEPTRDEYLIMQAGQLAGAGAHASSERGPTTWTPSRGATS